MSRQNRALLAAAMIGIAGCAQAPAQFEAVKATASSLFGGSSQDDPGKGGAAPTFTGGGAPQDAGTATGTAPDARKRSATSRASTVAVGGRKRVPIVSEELDKHCRQIAVPFDLEVNVAVLGRLAAEGALSWTQTKRPDTHALSKSLREQATRMNWLPMQVEKRYGQQMLQAKELEVIRRDERRGRQLYPLADQLFASVLEGVPEGPYAFELHIRKASEDNAIALPGGYILIDASLIAPEKQAEARFALGHELAHILQRHETRMTQAQIIDTLSLAGSVSDVLSSLRNPNAISDALLGTAARGRGVFRKHHEGQELQADACAVRILDQAFTELADVDAALQAFIRSLGKPEPPDPASKKLASRAASPMAAADQLLEEVERPIDRHPSTSERIANLTSMRRSIEQNRRNARVQQVGEAASSLGTTTPPGAAR